MDRKEQGRAKACIDMECSFLVLAFSHNLENKTLEKL